MTAGYLVVDPEGVRTRAREMLALATSIRARRDKLIDTIAPHESDQAWGGDDMGKQFRSKYGPHRGYAVDGLEQAALLLEAVARGLAMMAQRYENVEEAGSEVVAYLKSAAETTGENVGSMRKGAEEESGAEGSGESSVFSPGRSG